MTDRPERYSPDLEAYHHRTRSGPCFICKITGINIVRIEEGKIVESWGNNDQLGMMRRVGAVP